MRGVSRGCITWETIFEIDAKRDRIQQLDTEMALPGFWDDQVNASVRLKELNQIKSVLQTYEKLHKQSENLTEWITLDDSDRELIAEVESDIHLFVQAVRQLEIQSLLNKKYDAYDAIVGIYSGAGGLDAQDWGTMLSRMYQRWFEKQGYSVRVIDSVLGDQSGVKTLTFLVSGHLAYGYLKTESGVHRLVRISPFNAKDKRQTSFAAVDVVPHFDNRQDDFNIPSKDLKIDTYRASGAGGQHVNKTDSAVRITHVPTNIVAQSQDSRSQTENREMAMAVLKSRLIALKEKQQADHIATLKDTSDNAWGNQIRSYVLYPYKLVKDHRTGLENSDVDAVLNGDLGNFIHESLLTLYKHDH
ncbi:peptide chain release factor 2 [Candidatus Marinamargulisbacteria bacterium]|nr:peptide chain release factor 2 [bacterium]MDA7564028.1 peptide chain release factor 2 [Candidatus Marinamargulisbacteria bacterium]